MLQAQIEIVKNGQSLATIFIPAQPDSMTEKAAVQLQNYFQKMSGVKPEITKGLHNKPVTIYIGKNLLLPDDKTWLELSEFEDTFLIVAKNNEVYLAGKNPMGDIYAVNTLLEEYLGCMRFSVDEEFVPEYYNIIIPAVRKLYEPAFAFRVPHFIGRWNEDFCQWHKISSFDSWGMFVHTFQQLVPPEKYFDAHPEYFALVNGRRLKDGQLCLSNAEVIVLLANNLGEKMTENPDAVYWSVSQNDCINYCECENCQHLYERYGNISGAYIKMANQIAGIYPEKQISTLAYQFTRSAPKNIIPRKNVNIMFCSIECNRSMPLSDDPRSAGFVKDMKDWNQITDNIFAWDYVVQFQNYLTPFPNFTVLQPNIQFFRDNGVNMMFQQGSGHSWSDLSDLKQYLIAKLLWNPDLNADSVINHFMGNYYGKAAPFVRQYFNLMHQNLEKVKETQNLDIYGFPVFYYKAFLTPDLLLTYQSLMDEAEKAVLDDQTILKRVLRTRIPADFAFLDIALNTDNDKVKYIIKQDGRHKIDDKMLAKLDRFVELCQFTGVETINERNLKPADYVAFVKRKLEWQVKENLLKGAKLKSLTEYSPKYQVGGEKAMTDNLLGGLDFRFNWLGYEGNNMVMTADLGETKQFRKLQMNFLKAVESWVFLPEKVTLEISQDGRNFIEVATLSGDNSDRNYLQKSIPFVMEFEPVKARYLRISAISMLTCPEWHRGFGSPSWIFVDEMILE